MATQRGAISPLLEKILIKQYLNRELQSSIQNERLPEEFNDKEAIKMMIDRLYLKLKRSGDAIAWVKKFIAEVDKIRPYGVRNSQLSDKERNEEVLRVGLVAERIIEDASKDPMLYADSASANTNGR